MMFRASLLLFLSLGVLLQGAMALAEIPLHYFKSSIQTDIPAGEASFLVRENGCGGFLIKNGSNRIFIGTARHCFGNNEFGMCDPSNNFLTTQVGKYPGHCKNLVASSLKSDFFIFEADFGDKNDEIKSKFTSLTLGLITEDIGVHPLEVYGYPGDIRNFNPTKTYNCSSFSKTYDPEFTLFVGYNPGQMAFQQLLAQTNQRIKHNCSLYAGNSGGPVIFAGTTTVIGLPYTYVPSHPVYEDNYYGLLESLNNLYAEKSDLFEKLKIPVVKF
jgi:hypothetical protein